MIRRTEAPQLHLLSVLDVPRIAISPFKRNFGICVGVYKYIKCAIPVQLREKCHGSRNLPEDCLNLVLDLFFCFVRSRLRRAG